MSQRSGSTLDRADALLRQRRVRKALEYFHLAEQQGFDRNRCASGRWTACMLAGQFAAAWKESDAIRHREAPDLCSFCQDTIPRGKRLIVRCLHGLGDAVQFLRYASRLRALTSRLIIEVAPRMVDLARCIAGVEEVIPWGQLEGNGPRNWDSQVEVMELPYVFRTVMDDLPVANNYIAMPPAEIARARRIVGSSPTPRIGVVWSCGEWNLSRSIPLRLLRPLLERSDCHFWNLQGGIVRTQWSELWRSSTLRDAQELCDGGLLPLAAIISQLDLVITVDTLAAHLAGAMNIPVWIMLQHEADWRWMLSREDSPWYPSMRLFRQTRQGAWADVVAKVEQALEEWAPSVHRQRVA
jgi:hypothetical protein